LASFDARAIERPARYGWRRCTNVREAVGSLLRIDHHRRDARVRGRLPSGATAGETAPRTGASRHDLVKFSFGHGTVVEAHPMDTLRA